MVEWYFLFLQVIDSAFVGEIRLDLEIAAACAPGTVVVLTHPICRPSPWFPAFLLERDATDGNATVFYGWSSNAQDAWTRATVPAAGLSSYPCLRDEWQPDGDRGRGYDYLPRCEGVDCVTGCTVSDATVCGSRLDLGEVCSVECERDGWVNLTCDAYAWPELRRKECFAKIVYCDDVNASDDCVDRFGSTTPTTIAQADRNFLGCRELQQLEGMVGMPNTQMVSGAYYFEVAVLRGEEAGFVDAAQGQWLSPRESGAGHIGVALRFTGEDTAELRFSWQGVWGIPEQIQFSQHLIPVVVATESSWKIPADAWRFLPPSIYYNPLTQRAFPSDCNFPLDFEMMSQPPVCRDGLQPLDSPGECVDAAFYLGVLQSEALEGSYARWPGECFFCAECDAGDLFWNNASEVAVATIRSAPAAAALCRRRNVTVTVTEAFRPRLRLERSCGVGYAQLSNATDCEAAAIDLGLLDQLSVVTLPTVDTVRDGEVFWPGGCFYCPLCDTAHLFFNEVAAGLPAPGAGIEVGVETWLLCELEEGVASSSTSWHWTLPVTTTAANVIDEPIIEETSVPESTTLQVAAIVYLGDVRCEDAYQVPVVLQWWEDPDTWIMIGGGTVACCLASVCLWFWGICHRCCGCLCRCCVCYGSKKEVQEVSEEPIFFRPPPAWKRTQIPGLVL